MAETSTVARPYAKAAFEYARDHKALDAWSEWLGKVGMVVASQDVQKLLSSPKLDDERKVALVLEVADASVDDAARRVLDALSDKGRLAALPAIAEQFERLRAEHDKRVDVTVASAFELDDKQHQKLAGALKKRLNREISFTTRGAPTLLGAGSFSASDPLIDELVGARLNGVSEALSG